MIKPNSEMKAGRVLEAQAARKAKAAGQAVDARKSIFGHTYPGSTEVNWHHLEGLGWYHDIERRAVNESCSQCCATNKWGFTASMARINPLGKYILMDVAKKDYEFCRHANIWVDKGDFVDGFDQHGTPTRISRGYAERAFFVSDFSKKHWPSHLCVRIVASKYKQVAVPELKGNFDSCPECANYYDIARIHERDIQLDGKNIKTCDKCYIKMKYEGIINAHNYDGYPKPLYSHKERYGHKIVDGVVWATKKKEQVKEIRLFGWEMETEMDMAGCKRDGLVRHEVAARILEALGKDYVIAKEDGTLVMNGKYSGGDADPNGTGVTYAGFEVVSGPADLQVHRERLPKLEQAIGYKHLRAWDTETCGFHVHVTREALTHLQIARILRFINHPKNQHFIMKIAGRGSAKFCRYVPKEPKDALRVDPRTDENRRQAVNLCNPKTIEFRIFRGTVNPKHILRNLEFCDAVCDFAHPASRSFAEYEDYKSFIRFVDGNRKKWPLLASWFGFHKMIEMDITEKIVVRKRTSVVNRMGKAKSKVLSVETKLDTSKFTLQRGHVVEPEIRVGNKGEALAFKGAKAQVFEEDEEVAVAEEDEEGDF